MLSGIDTRPGHPAIDRPIHAATNFASLISIADEDFIPIARIDQDTGEIAERKIATPPVPVCPTVWRHVEGLLRSDIYMVRPLRILRYGIYGGIARHPGDLLPRLPSVARKQGARGSSAYKNRFRLLGISRDTTGTRI